MGAGHNAIRRAVEACPRSSPETQEARGAPRSSCLQEAPLRAGITLAPLAPARGRRLGRSPISRTKQLRWAPSAGRVIADWARPRARLRSRAPVCALTVGQLAKIIGPSGARQVDNQHQKGGALPLVSAAPSTDLELDAANFRLRSPAAGPDQAWRRSSGGHRRQASGSTWRRKQRLGAHRYAPFWCALDATYSLCLAGATRFRARLRMGWWRGGGPLAGNTETVGAPTSRTVRITQLASRMTTSLRVPERRPDKLFHAPRAHLACGFGCSSSFVLCVAGGVLLSCVSFRLSIKKEKEKTSSARVFLSPGLN